MAQWYPQDKLTAPPNPGRRRPSSGLHVPLLQGPRTNQLAQ